MEEAEGGREVLRVSVPFEGGRRRADDLAGDLEEGSQSQDEDSPVETV